MTDTTAPTARYTAEFVAVGNDTHGDGYGAVAVFDNTDGSIVFICMEEADAVSWVARHEPAVGCDICGAVGIPVIGHADVCPGARTYTVDNRWSAEATGRVTGHAIVAYAGRWIDRGDVAEILADRQGFAYNDEADRNAMAQSMVLRIADIRNIEGLASGDVVNTMVFNTGRGAVHMRRLRRDGYVYVDAWMQSITG